MTSATQRVFLVGGSLHGREWDAPLPPGALTIALKDGDREWRETYIYVSGHVENGLPVMSHSRRIGEATAAEEQQ